MRNKEIDMKTSAELLGVSYGTLYGRYRDTFGYLKSGWNVGGVPPPAPVITGYRSARSLPTSGGGAPSVEINNANEDVDQERILADLREGKIDKKQAGNLLGMDESMLSYHMESKVSY